MYFIINKLSSKFCFVIRYFLYRKSVMEPENIFLLLNSEKAYKDIEKKNKPIATYFTNSKKKIGVLGSLSNSLIFNTTSWENAPKEKFDLFLYEFLANGYKSDSKLNQYNHYIIEGFYYKGKINRVLKDTFDYKLLADRINKDQLDVLIVSIETLGRFTYSKLFDEIITNTKIILLNPGNTFYFHPKIFIQSQIQLPPCWKVENNKLLHSSGKKISDFRFVNNLFLYDKRDLETPSSINTIFENVIFAHGRLSKIVQEEYLETVSELLDKDKKRKFIFMGLDDQNSLSKITTFFQQKNQTKQIKYLGSYSQSKDENGKISDKNWQLCKEYLNNSAVFLNPFPKGAGSSRVEAFASGLPVIDFEIDFMDCNNKNKKAYILEPLIKQHGTAYSKEEYLELSEKAFTDLEFRKKIIQEQYRIVNEFCDEKVFWDKIIDAITLSEKL